MADASTEAACVRLVGLGRIAQFACAPETTATATENASTALAIVSQDGPEQIAVFRSVRTVALATANATTELVSAMLGSMASTARSATARTCALATACATTASVSATPATQAMIARTGAVRTTALDTEPATTALARAMALGPGVPATRRFAPTIVLATDTVMLVPTVSANVSVRKAGRDQIAPSQSLQLVIREAPSCNKTKPNQLPKADWQICKMLSVCDQSVFE